MSPRKGSLPPRDTDCRARPIRFHCSAGRGVRKSANQTWRGWSRRVEALCVLSLYDLITSEQPAVPAGTESSSLSTSDAVLDQQQLLDYDSWLLFALFCFVLFFFNNVNGVLFKTLIWVNWLLPDTQKSKRGSHFKARLFTIFIY